MASSENGSEDMYMKKIWKILSKEKTMDDMRRALQDNNGYKIYQEDIKKELKDIIDGSVEVKSYEKIFSELGGIDYSQVEEQDLEILIKQAVDLKIRSLSEDTKENIFQEWDEIVDKYHKRRQT